MAAVFEAEGQPPTPIECPGTPTFAFRFVPAEERARYVVTVVGVGERSADE